ncbi:MAG: LPS export ABC transporter periplasmic protein LptC [Parabacteroides sp.]|nr:LPS export ABC transporter periplasmic protein LptC [Parabacteroides sp.]
MIHSSKDGVIHSSITATLWVAVMLLLLTLACSGEHKEVVEVTFDPETTYTMKTTGVISLISDSGVTRYRANAKEWLVYGKAKEPYWYFPKGIYVEKFDSLFHAEASIVADTAYYYDKQGLFRFVGQVEVKSLQGEHFETDELFWNQKEDKVYSDRFIRIEQEEKVITGIGFESNQNMTRYTIRESRGVFPVATTSPADTTKQE